MYDDLVETVYIAQFHGFVDLARPTHVCNLQKSIYEPKQAPRSWFQLLDFEKPLISFIVLRENL